MKLYTSAYCETNLTCWRPVANLGSSTLYNSSNGFHPRINRPYQKLVSHPILSFEHFVILDKIRSPWFVVWVLFEFAQSLFRQKVVFLWHMLLHHQNRSLFDLLALFFFVFSLKVHRILLQSDLWSPIWWSKFSCNNPNHHTSTNNNGCPLQLHCQAGTLTLSPCSAISLAITRDPEYLGKTRTLRIALLKNNCYVSSKLWREHMFWKCRISFTASPQNHSNANF